MPILILRSHIMNSTQLRTSSQNLESNISLYTPNSWLCWKRTICIISSSLNSITLTHCLPVGDIFLFYWYWHGFYFKNGLHNFFFFKRSRGLGHSSIPLPYNLRNQYFSFDPVCYLYRPNPQYPFIKLWINKLHRMSLRESTIP